MWFHAKVLRRMLRRTFLTGRRPSKLLHLTAVVAAVFALCGCSQERNTIFRDQFLTHESTVAFLDPQVIQLDVGEEGYWFDGNGGSIFLSMRCMGGT